MPVELGEVADIDRRIGELRDALTDPSSDVVPRLVRADSMSKLMRPIRKLLGETSE